MQTGNRLDGYASLSTNENWSNGRRGTQRVRDRQTPPVAEAFGPITAGSKNYHDQLHVRKCRSNRISLSMAVQCFRGVPLVSRHTNLATLLYFGPKFATKKYARE